MTTDLSKYRPNVAIILINKEGLVWIGERSDIPGAWQMPQGGIDDGDTIQETAYKELKEETGINPTEVTYIGETDEWLTYEFPHKATPKEGRGKIWKGQKQKFVLFYFKGKHKNINLHKATDKEFSRWKWHPWQDILAEAADFRKPSYEKAFASFPEKFK